LEERKTIVKTTSGWLSVVLPLITVWIVGLLALSGQTSHAQLPPGTVVDWEMPKRFGDDYTTYTVNGRTYQKINFHWDETSRTYDPAYVHPTDWPVKLKLNVLELGVVSYTWYVNGAPVGTHSPGWLPGTIRHEHRFPTLGTYSVSVTVNFTNGLSQTVSGAVTLQDYLIISIGDSYSSGEGSPDVPQEYDWLGLLVERRAKWADRRTHRSGFSGPAQAAKQIEDADPHTSVTFLSFACSGARIESGLIGPYNADSDWEVQGTELSQLAQVWNALIRDSEGPSYWRDVDALLIGIGGNDAGFGEFIIKCLNPTPVTEQSGISDWTNEKMRKVADNFNLLGAEMKWTMRGLVVKRVFITEYPDPTRDEDGELSGFPGMLFTIDREDARYAAEEFLPRLNALVRQAAENNGWHYVGGIAELFRQGHGVPAGDQRWINTWEDSVHTQGPPLVGISLWSDLFVEGAAWLRTPGTLHPNRDGFEAIANRLREDFMLHIAHPPNAFYVNAAYVGWEDGTPAHPFHTVSRALNAASSTATTTIYVRANNYNERPRITKPVRILNWGDMGVVRVGTP
jgi:hypothetical protein